MPKSDRCGGGYPERRYWTAASRSNTSRTATMRAATRTGASATPFQWTPAMQAEFDARFSHEVALVRALHDEHDKGLHRWSRFERR